MKTPDYLSYEKYKKKKNANPNKRLLIFVTTFFATLLFFSVTAKNLSPDVDVTIGNESEAEPKETGLGVKRFIDDRLKMIQMEDGSAGVSIAEKAKKQEQVSPKQVSDGIDDELQFEEEKMNLPSKKDKTKTLVEDEEDVMPAYNTPPRPGKKDLAVPAEQAASKISKVYVGRYSTIEQAKVAQEILMDSGINVSPFVKFVGGAYTLQIGSYSSRAKADELSAELRRNNFPARVVQE